MSFAIVIVLIGIPLYAFLRPTQASRLKAADPQRDANVLPFTGEAKSGV